MDILLKPPQPLMGLFLSIQGKKTLAYEMKKIILHEVNFNNMR